MKASSCIKDKEGRLKKRSVSRFYPRIVVISQNPPILCADSWLSSIRNRFPMFVDYTFIHILFCSIIIFIPSTHVPCSTTTNTLLQSTPCVNLQNTLLRTLLLSRRWLCLCSTTMSTFWLPLQSLSQFFWASVCILLICYTRRARRRYSSSHSPYSTD